MGLLPIPVSLQVRILKTLVHPTPLPEATVYDGRSKLETLLGKDLLPSIKDKIVIDFGCGYGFQTIELAQAGARRVIGLEINPDCLTAAAENARRAGVADKCQFSEFADEKADAVVSLDCFEHYEDPSAILACIRDLLKPGGALLVSWGPPWYHPRGMHLNELPPWTHVFFAEEAVLRWRQLMRGGTATTYSEVGLNQMTVSRFEKLVRLSGLKIESLKVVPIRPLRLIHNRWTREFTTSIVQSKLVKI
jgi:2-polyprenyl-3-methyl-5-hydroxy-6-metoxy-1,4-benzoquinol methylase